MGSAIKAIKYILERIQINPDLRYYAGPGSEIFHLLVQAEAEIENKTALEVETKRSEDTQPKHRKRKPEVLELRIWKAIAERYINHEDLPEIEEEFEKRIS